MTLWSSILAALEALCANTLRTALTMLGVIISVAAVIAAVAIATGAHARVTAQIQSLGLNLLLVLSGSFSAGGIRRGAGTLQPSPRTTPGRYAAASAATSYTSRHA